MVTVMPGAWRRCTDFGGQRNLAPPVLGRAGGRFSKAWQGRRARQARGKGSKEGKQGRAGRHGRAAKQSRIGGRVARQGREGDKVARLGREGPQGRPPPSAIKA